MFIKDNLKFTQKDIYRIRRSNDGSRTYCIF